MSIDPWSDTAHGFHGLTTFECTHLYGLGSIRADDHEVTKALAASPERADLYGFDYCPKCGEEL